MVRKDAKIPPMGDASKVFQRWAVAPHYILEVDFFTGRAAFGRFGIFGKPLIYAIFAVTLVGADAGGAEEQALDTLPTGT
jgi:hypothetical protein